MINRDKVFDAFRNCITEPKCKDCPWEQCEQFNQKKTEIPITLALDVIELLKEQEPVNALADGEGSYICSNCGTVIGWDEFEICGIDSVRYKFCPECGRKVNRYA